MSIGIEFSTKNVEGYQCILRTKSRSNSRFDKNRVELHINLRLLRIET